MRLLVFAGYVPYWWAQQLLRAFITDTDSESVSFSEREDTWAVKLKVGRQHHILFLLELLACIHLFQCLDIKRKWRSEKTQDSPQEDSQTYYITFNDNKLNEVYSWDVENVGSAP